MPTAVFLALVASALGACVAKPVYTIDAAVPLRGTVSDTTIAVVDKRPAQDRESSMGSLLITSSSYGIHTLGDERFEPAPVAALSQRLQRAGTTWPERPQTITLTLNRFNTQNNMQAAMRHGAMSSTGLTSLGMDLGEALLGKMREQNIDLRKPFVLCVIEASVDIRWRNGRSEPRTLSVTKAQNYNEGTAQDQIGRIIAATVTDTLDAAVAALGK
jgi:hypothetical protein